MLSRKLQGVCERAVVGGGNTYAKYIFNPHRSWRDDSGNPTGTRIVDKAYAAKYRLNSIYGIENFLVVRYYEIAICKSMKRKKGRSRASICF